VEGELVEAHQAPAIATRIKGACFRTHA
jgi:hypothetical protein